MSKLILPSKKNDSGEISTVVYTVTIAISVALLVYTISSTTPGNEKHLPNDWMNIVAASSLTLSCLLLFHAMDTLADVISFRYFYPSN